MGQDKGKARKSFSWDKSKDRVANYYGSDDYANNVRNPQIIPMEEAWKLKASKNNISPAQRKLYLGRASEAKYQWESAKAKGIISDTQGGPKMKVKGHGN